MNLRAIVGGTALAIVASVGFVSTQTPAPATVDSLVSAAKNAAGLEWAGTFLRLCVVPPPAEPRTAGAAARPGAGSRPPRRPAFRRAAATALRRSASTGASAPTAV